MKIQNLSDKLKKYFGFDTFKGDQEAIIRNVLAGKDTFVLMPTGGGKSLCYQLPALLMEGTAIVISPLIALMKNQVDAIRMVSEDDGIAHFINSSLTKAEIDKAKEDIRTGRTKLLYLAPESLTKEENVDFLEGFCDFILNLTIVIPHNAQESCICAAGNCIVFNHPTIYIIDLAIF